MVDEIKTKEKRLETLPLCILKKNESGNDELLIISGHHRVRAARMANVKEIYVMTLDEELSKSQIISKQLAHNALSGYDDPQLLAELYNEIDDLQARIESGITDAELKQIMQDVSVDDISLDIDYEAVYLLFLPEQKQKFDDILAMIEGKEKLYVSDIKVFLKFKEAVRAVSHSEEVRNVTAIISKMCDIVKEYYLEKSN